MGRVSRLRWEGDRPVVQFDLQVVHCNTERCIVTQKAMTCLAYITGRESWLGGRLGGQVGVREGEGELAGRQVGWTGGSKGGRGRAGWEAGWVDRWE